VRLLAGLAILAVLLLASLLLRDYWKERP